MMLTQARLKQLLRYDEGTGSFTWLMASGKRTDIVGKPAGFDSNGYKYICIDYVKHPAHVLAWLYVHGEFPTDEIDHINRVRSDNRISNLRTATHIQNTANQPVRKNNKTGVPGVSWDEQTGKWRAHISPNGKMISLGRHAEFLEAVQARKIAERKHFGEFVGESRV